MAWWQTNLKIGAGVIGVALMTAPFFYEDEARRLQNRIDDLWQRTQRGEERSRGFHNTVLHESASVLADWLDRLFENRWTSPRKISLLVVFSVAAYVVFLWLMAKTVTVAVLNLTVEMKKLDIPQDPKPIAEMVRLNRQMDIGCGPAIARAGCREFEPGRPSPHVQCRPVRDRDSGRALHDVRDRCALLRQIPRWRVWPVTRNDRLSMQLVAPLGLDYDKGAWLLP